MNSIVKHGQRILALVVLSLLLTACGSKEVRQLGIDGYVYTANEISSSVSNNARISNLVAAGDFLYYALFDGTVTALKKVPVKEEMDFEEAQTVFRDFPGEYYTVDQDQNIYYLKGKILVKCREDGTEAYRFTVQLSDGTISLMGSEKLLAADGEGRCCILSDAGIYLVDAQGNQDGMISTLEYKPESTGKKEYLAQGADGRVYYCFIDTNSSGMYAWEIKYDGKYLEKTEEAKGTTDYYSSAYGLCVSRDGSLYQYQSADASFRELLRWQDSNLDENVSEIVQLSENSFLARYTVGDELFLLTRTETDKLPQKEIIVLACVTPSLELTDKIIAFNRSSDSYHVSIEAYTGTEGLTLLDSRLVSGDPPDLLDLSDLDLVKYAQKQVLEDLTPYLGKSSVVSCEDFLDGVIESYTINDRLVCIPTKFWFFAAMGRSGQLGEEAGWTMEEVYALTDRYPEMQLFDYNDFDYILGEFCGRYIMEKFIDWEEGTCSFDTDEFRDLVCWAKEHSGDGNARSYVDDNTLLIRRQIMIISDYVRYEYLFGCPITMVGYPTVNGAPMYPVDIQDAVGIVSKSGHKDGAWAFLEYFLEAEGEEAAYLQVNELSTYKRIMEGAIEEESTYRYTDTGAGVRKGNFFINGETIEYYGLTQEQARAIRNMIASVDFTPQGGIEQDVIDIILEEAGEYYDGRRALKEVTGIIQERAELLIQEYKLTGR